jgi:cobalamin biosynthesis Mg chelatase CobN
MAKRKRQQPEVHPEELVGDGSETREKRRFRLSNWSGKRTASVEELPPEDAADVAVVTDEQEAVESGEAAPEGTDTEGTASRPEPVADDAASAAGSAEDEDSASDAEASGTRAARRSGNPARSGRFQPAAEDSGDDAGASRIAVEDEIHEERLRRVAEEMTAGVGDRSVTPTWYKALMLGLMIVGLLWIIVWYITQSALPIPQIGYGNIGVGIGLMMVGLIMTTRWK